MIGRVHVDKYLRSVQGGFNLLLLDQVGFVDGVSADGRTVCFLFSSEVEGRVVEEFKRGAHLHLIYGAGLCLRVSGNFFAPN